MKTSFAALALAAAVTAAATPSSALSLFGMGTPDASQFRAKVAAGDGFEIAAGRIAISHSSTPIMKTFGQVMVDDHTKDAGKLASLGGPNPGALEAKMKPVNGKFAANDVIDSDHADQLNALNGKSHDAFMAAYLNSQVKAHQDMLSLLQDYAKNGDDPKLKAFAQQGIPMVQAHLNKAAALQRAISA